MSEQQKQANKFVVTTEVLQAVLTYLASRPYAEVSPLIAQIQTTSRPFQEPAPVAPTAPELVKAAE